MTDSESEAFLQGMFCMIICFVVIYFLIDIWTRLGEQGERLWEVETIITRSKAHKVAQEAQMASDRKTSKTEPISEVRPG